MSEILIKRLEKIISECDKHLMRMKSAYNKMSLFMPLDEKKYAELNEDYIEHIDQFLFRFAKIQDAIGERLFVNTLRYLDEPVEGKPYIDLLNRLETLNILDSVDQWRELRRIRNEISHQYEDDPEEMASAINLIYNKKDELENIYKNLKKIVRTQFSKYV